MIVIGIVGSIYFGNLTELNTVIMSEGSRAIEFTISLAAIMALWMGIMNIAKDSGLIDKIGQKMNFILKALFNNEYNAPLWKKAGYNPPPKPGSLKKTVYEQADTEKTK